MTGDEIKKKYRKYVDRVTPKHNTGRNMFRAFWTGGLICMLGQAVSSHLMEYLNLDKKLAGIWTLIIFVAASVLLTAFHLFGRITKYAGAGVLVPITGFANGVASPAVEYAPEGEVFGKGVQIFTIAGPVILYGAAASWILGIIYWCTVFLGQR